MASLKVGLISTVSPPEFGRAQGGGDMASAAALLDRARCVLQVLVVYMGHWTHAHTAVAAALAALGTYCRAASALAALRGQVCGLMGQRSMGMIAAAVDPSGWLRQFGVDIDDWDMLETVERARAIPDDAPRIACYAKWLSAEFGRVAVNGDTLSASIKLYLASKKIVQSRGYDFVAVKCLPYMPEIYTTFCFAAAMLNDDSDTEDARPRVPCACESDANGALTMQVMNLLSGAP